jgi:Flp pilus assembly pilin Flp
MMRNLLRLRDDERGSSLVELALVAPFLATLILGVVDLSNGYAARLRLEQAAQRSVEKAMQGNKETGLYDALKAEAAATADVDEADVEVRYWVECDGVSLNTDPATMTDDFEQVCDPGEYMSRHVNVRIEKDYMPMFNLPLPGRNADGSFTLNGEAGIRVQ